MGSSITTASPVFRERAWISKGSVDYAHPARAAYNIPVGAVYQDTWQNLDAQRERRNVPDADDESWQPPCARKKIRNVYHAFSSI
jgi:hypothetical protein